jgi:hypothetical protein
MREAALTSLAILKVNWDASGMDYVECFVPFAVECIRLSPVEAVSLPTLQQQLKTQFSIDIPLNPLRMVLTRASKRGYLRREHGVFYRNTRECSNTRFREQQAKVEATYDGVLRKLRDYARENHNLDWSESDGAEALHTFLRDNSLSLLFTIAEGGLYLAPREQTGQCFIVGSFVAEAQEKDNRVVEDMVVLLQGNLLSNALYLPDPGKVSQRFRGTRVYLDTSIIAFAAGFAGSARAAPCLELIALLKQYGASLYCFRGTYDEVRGILDACASRLGRGQLRDSFGPSMEYFIETGRTASDVELLAARLPHKLKELGVSVDEKPPYEKDYQIDEKGFEEAIDKEIHYVSPKARIHDVDCISAVARLRRGRESYFPETSWAIFVTSNAPLARVTRRYFQLEASPGAVALCMTDYALGNLLWLKNPTIAPDMPRKHLLAHAYAAMQPPEDLWKRYLAEIARLQDTETISSDDYYLLRHSLAAKSALMDLTQGDDAAFAEGTVQEVLEVAKERLRADLREAVSREQHERRRIESQLQKYEEDNTLRRAALGMKAARIARHLRRALLSTGAVAVSLGICYTFPWELPRPTEAWARYSIAFLLILLLLLSVGNLMWGATLDDLLARLERRVANRLSTRLLAFAEMEQDTQTGSSKGDL